jgi:ribosomal protein S18 acetylase RimI-like enzyme
LAGGCATGVDVSDAVVRLMELADLTAVEALWIQYDNFHHSLGLAFPQPEQAAAAWRASFERTLGRFSYVWVAEKDGLVAGFLLARLKRTPAFLGGVLVGEISDLYVSDALRGQKVGSRLAAAAIETLRAQRVHSIEVQVLQHNTGAMAFWQEQGFDIELTQFRLPVPEE